VLARAISRPSGAVTASSTPAVSAGGFSPAALEALGADLATGDALAGLPLGPPPEPGRQRSRAQLVAALRRGGRQARATQIQAALGAPQLPRLGRAAMPLGGGPGRRWAAGQPQPADQQLGGGTGRGFNQHPDARTIPVRAGADGPGVRVLGEFGDDQTRLPTAKSPKTYAGRHPAPRPRAARWSCSPVLAATAGSPMRWSRGRSAPDHPALAATTTSSEPATRPTAKPCPSSPTAGSASSTPAQIAASSPPNISPGATISPRPLDSLHTWDA
jgi:hypothetical protein